VLIAEFEQAIRSREILEFCARMRGEEILNFGTREKLKITQDLGRLSHVFRVRLISYTEWIE